jgi:ATP-dependent protease Clp ATPase subunit
VGGVDSRSGSGGHAPGAHLACSFCGTARPDVRKLIAGSGGYICDACVGLAGGVISSGSPAETALGTVHAVPEQNGQAHCSFCGKPRYRVDGLAETQGGTSICVECLSLCNEILDEELS